VIALQLALDAPELVYSLALLEPALRAGTEGQAHLQRTIGPARERYSAGDKRGFITDFTEGVFGPGWEPIVERALPGAIDQAVADAETFFAEQPALLQWQFGPEEAARIKQPVLSVLGTRSAPIFQEGRAVLHSWLPQTEDLDVDATHMLQIQDPAAVAGGLAAFFARHPF
jgi:pimeloyl-ACP methyl ester carboxylesterase